MTTDGPLYVIVEYARHGNLRDFLRTHRPRNALGSGMGNLTSYDDFNLTYKHLANFSYQVASGMQYLATNQVNSKAAVIFLLVFIQPTAITT